MADAVEFDGGPVHLVDSIVHSVVSKKGETKLENCAGFGMGMPFVGKIKLSDDCFTASPQFANPAMLDYHLMPTSPCKGKASDGGDLGVRYTPEMIEVLKIALELRAKGIIKF